MLFTLDKKLVAFNFDVSSIHISFYLSDKSVASIFSSGFMSGLINIPLETLDLLYSTTSASKTRASLTSIGLGLDYTCPNKSNRVNTYIIIGELQYLSTCFHVLLSVRGPWCTIRAIVNNKHNLIELMIISLKIVCSQCRGRYSLLTLQVEFDHSL